MCVGLLAGINVTLRRSQQRTGREQAGESPAAVEGSWLRCGVGDLALVNGCLAPGNTSATDFHGHSSEWMAPKGAV